MDQQKKLLSSLLANSLDRATLLYNLTSLKVQYDDEEPSVILKYKLQLRVVENIFKGINRTEENVYYETLMKESKDYLRFHHQKTRSQHINAVWLDVFSSAGGTEITLDIFSELIPKKQE